jgi:mono/diheme cytochrome c family protein
VRADVDIDVGPCHFRRRHIMNRVESTLWLLGVLCLGAPGLVACSRNADDLREWRATDHKHTSESTPESAQEAPQVSGSAETKIPGLDEVTIASYRRGCATCHGQLGRGDGPQGPMVKARDLSDPTWQASATDAQIADAITRGRGRMPAFSLPAPTVDGLVHLVRLFNRARAAEAAPGGPAPAAAAPTRGGGSQPASPGPSASTAK